MSHPSLTPAEAERLEMLAEEASEIAQECMKILRHGYGSYHPRDPDRVVNRMRLMSEIGDFIGVRRLMYEAGDLSAPTISYYADKKVEKCRQWTYHQAFRPEVRADDH